MFKKSDSFPNGTAVLLKSKLLVVHDPIAIGLIKNYYNYYKLKDLTEFSAIEILTK